MRERTLRLSHTLNHPKHGAKLTRALSLLVMLVLAECPLPAAERTDHSPASWRLAIERRRHTATLLSEGEILIAGGENENGMVRRAELFDVRSRRSSLVGPLLNSRSEHTATKLADGRVLVVGGRNEKGSLDSTELFDGGVRSFVPGPGLNHARFGHTATLLKDGRIVVVGGDREGTIEVFDPVTDRFQVVAARLRRPRKLHSTALLRDGGLLIVGGIAEDGGLLDTAEILETRSMQLRFTGNLKMQSGRRSPALNVLPDGKVQVIGGDDRSTIEIFNPSGLYFSAHAQLIVRPDAPTALLATRSRTALFGIHQRHVSEPSPDPGPSTSPEREPLLDREGFASAEAPDLGVAVVAGGTSENGRALGTAVLLSASAATVSTDKTDYAPGEIVTISGTGWQPGETVLLTLYEEPESPTPPPALTAVADGNGDFENSQFSPDEHDGGVTFSLVATGESSGFIANTTFRDSLSTTTTVTGDPNPSVEGQAVAFTAAVQDPYGNLVSDGTVDFYVDGNFHSRVSPGGDNLYHLSVSTLVVGSHQILAFFTPACYPYNYCCVFFCCGGFGCPTCCGASCTSCAPNFTSSTGSTTQTVNPARAETSTTLVVDTNPSAQGQSITFTATVTAVSGTPTGNITFRDGSAVLGSGILDAAGQVEMGTSTLSPGNHSITASYEGPTGFEPSTSAVLTQVVSALAMTQRNALIDLYNSTSGASWTNRTNWLGAPGTECSWYGIRCNAAGDAITEIVMFNNNLSGPLPPSIGDFPGLNELVLMHNPMGGSIPPEIGNLRTLRVLSLEGDRLAGALPEEIGSLSELVILSVFINQLSGPIPASIFTLPRLEELSLANNAFTGGIPPGIGNLTSLTYLFLASNPLSGSIPVELANLTNLRTLNLSFTGLTGGIPTELSTLSRLQSLILAFNGLSGPIPSSLGNLSNLVRLWLNGNELTGGIPREIGQLTRLSDFRVYSNRLSGSIPAEVGLLTELRELQLHANQLAGPLPSTLASLTLLTPGQLDLRWNALFTNDAALKSFLDSRQAGGDWEGTQTIAPSGISAAFGSPGSLQVSWTPIPYTADTGGYRVLRADAPGGPYTLAGTTSTKADSGLTLTGLTPGTYYLTVESFTNPHSFNRNTVFSSPSAAVSGTVVPSISTSERNALVALYNSTNGAGWTNRTNWLGDPGTECTWFGVICNSAKTSVVRLSLVSNNLTGPLPPEIGNLPSLQEIVFQFNRISGPLPPEIGDLASLQTLSLVGNQITGPLPAEIGNLSQLQILDLFINQVTGSIPASIGRMASLRELNFSLNRLTGPIPTEIGNLTALTFLHAGGNLFTGSIPSSIGNLANLSTLFLFNNRLTGTIPPELGSLPRLQQLYLGLNMLEGEIPSSFGNLGQLVILRLDQNRLSGSIPPQLGSLTRLTELYLNSNQLSGAIPGELGGPAQLRRLFLNGNKLAGAIPATLGSLSVLEAGQLDLRWNGLHTNDGGLKTFLDGKQVGGSWENTQTIPPAGVSGSSAGAGSIRVAWTPIAYTADAGGYRVSYSASSGGPYTLGGTTPTKSDSILTLTGLSPGRYYLVVQAVTNPHSNNQNMVVSEASAEVSASTQITPTITWSNPADITYGTALGSAQLNATADAPGSFTYDPPAGSVLDAGAGRTLSVTFTPADPVTYTTASKSVTINVLKATPVITWANPADIVYGTPLGAAQLNATADVPGSFVYSPPAGTVLNAAPSQALIVTFTPTDTANYESTQKTVSIRVAAAPLTIRANDATKVYGEPLPAFSATPTGFVAGDGMGSLSGTLTLTTTATATSPVGTYGIVPSGVSSNNYAIAFVSGTLTIQQASTTTALTSSANPAGLGQPVTFTATVSPVAPGAGSPTGTVQFLEGSSVLGSVGLSGGAASLTTTLAPGTHTIAAEYSGETNFVGSSGSIGQTVNSPSASTTTTVTSSLHPARATDSITLTATVAPLSGGGNPTGSVAFFDGQTPLGTGSLAISKGKNQAAVNVILSGTGFHSLTAVYQGDSSFAGSTSTPVAQTIYTGTAPTETKTTITSAPSTVVPVGQSFGFAALVEVLRGRRSIPSGPVRLLVDGQVVAVSSLDGAGKVAFVVPGQPSGVHFVIVQYMGDAAVQYAASTSATSYVFVQ